MCKCQGKQRHHPDSRPAQRPRSAIRARCPARHTEPTTECGAASPAAVGQREAGTRQQNQPAGYDRAAHATAETLPGDSESEGKVYDRGQQPG